MKTKSKEWNDGSGSFTLSDRMHRAFQGKSGISEKRYIIIFWFVEMDGNTEDYSIEDEDGKVKTFTHREALAWIHQNADTFYEDSCGIKSTANNFTIKELAL